MRRLLTGLMLLAITGCGETPPHQAVAPPPTAGASRLTLTPAAWDTLPGWREDTVSAVLPALQRTCDRLAKLPFDRSVGNDGLGGTVADWSAACGAVRHVPARDDAAARIFFQQWFSPFLAADNGKADGVFTGYYEPELAGSRLPQGRFQVPLLARPKDLVTIDLSRFRSDLGNEQLAGRVNGSRVEPYPTRAEIEGGGLGDLAQPLLWLNDAVDAHILHIQGSGRIRLEDGSVVRVGVSGTNGRPFTGLGKLLAERGKLEGGSSMPAIRTWLKAHPDEARGIMAGNPRYVFYRLSDGDGPVGTEGVALTAERSLAVDPRYVPLGVPLWLDTTAPSGRALRRVMMAQDTGGAIKGPVRGDVFWGTGDAAFEQAGRMKSTGRYWLLLPAQRSPRLAGGLQ
jgi:membrane-bound lytic murein transglycosylase A